MLQEARNPDKRGMVVFMIFLFGAIAHTKGKGNLKFNGRPAFSLKVNNEDHSLRLFHGDRQKSMGK
jgi:hypothetical protein